MALKRVTGQFLELLAYIRHRFPKLLTVEVVAEIAAHTGVVFEESAILNAEAELCLTRKIGSVNARQYLTPRAQLRLHLFRTCAPPLGVFGISFRDIIDIDEAGKNLDDANRKYGKSPRGTRANEVGNYTRTQNLTAVLAVGGDEYKYLKIYEGGVGAEKLNDYFVNLLADLAAQVPFRPRVLMCDNLSAHHCPAILTAVLAAGHHLVYRPPYMPWIAPVEYCFNQLTQYMGSQTYKVTDAAQVQPLIGRAVRKITGIGETFNKLGYN